MVLRSILALLVVVSSISFSSFAADQADKKPLVFVEDLKPSEASERLIYPGQVLSTVNARLAADTDGMVTKILKSVGSAVLRGQTVMVITNTDPAYNYAPLQVRATVSGVVGSLDVGVGSQVSKGQSLGSLLDPAKIKVVAEVPAGDLAKIQRNQECALFLEGGETPMKLRVLTIAPVVDPASGTARAEFELLSASSSVALTPGQLGRVELKSGQRQALLVPQDAVIYRDGKKFLRRVESSRSVLVPVVLGKTFGEKVEISNGVRAGDKIVLRSSTFVANGQEISIYQPEADAKAKPPAAQAR